MISASSRGRALLSTDKDRKVQREGGRGPRPAAQVTAEPRSSGGRAAGNCRGLRGPRVAPPLPLTLPFLGLPFKNSVTRRIAPPAPGPEGAATLAPGPPPAALRARETPPASHPDSPPFATFLVGPTLLTHALSVPHPGVGRSSFPPRP